MRVLAGVEEAGGSYFCPTCSENGSPGKVHKAHDVATSENGRKERLKIVMSSSTLHECWKYGGYEIRCDAITLFVLELILISSQ